MAFPWSVIFWQKNCSLASLVRLVLVQHTKPISDMIHSMKNGTYHHHTGNHCLLFLQDPESAGKNAKSILDKFSAIYQFAVEHPLINTHASPGKGFLAKS